MSEPNIIKKLDENVVNRIAAGEIVQRPANALKELIENSLDAHSTNIIITVKAGGLKYLQIQDNGSGIRNDNLDIVCERFTTSKLSQYEDLQYINTYGFRGEALASISHIAHLTILTKTVNDKCAYKASYENGKLKGPIKPCAGNNGTQITVEDLFYNVIARKRALRSPNEEYMHIMDVVGGYAIHNSKVGFTLKKFGENTDIKTPIRSSIIDNVRIIYGNYIARELLEIELKDTSLKLCIHGFITNVNFSHKKGTMLLFINHRLVNSPSIRRAIDTVYATYLPKNGHSYVYLSIELDPKNVDVNVHPTKHEVQFLYEEQIIEKIKTLIESKLLSCNSSRVMYTQARLPGATTVDEIVRKTTDGAKIYAKDLVRVNSDAQKIDKFFHVTTKDAEYQYDYSTVTNKNEATLEPVFPVQEETHDSIDQKLEIENMAVYNINFNRQIDHNEASVGDSVYEAMHDIIAQNLKTDKSKGVTNEMNDNNIYYDINNYIQTDHKATIKENEVDMNEYYNLPGTSQQFNNLNSSLFLEPNNRWSKEDKWKSTTVDNAILYIDPKESFKTRTFNCERVETKLTSVKRLRLDIENKCNMNLREILANLIFIACVDCHRSLIQHSTKLYLCDTTRLAEELFYETVLFDFLNLGLIKLSNPLPLVELLMLGLQSQKEEWNTALGFMSEMAKQMCGLLVSKRAMLLEYFSLEITSNGKLSALPLLLDNHAPFMGALPTYLVRLVTEVNWKSEKECFDTFCRQTAIFYSQPNTDTSEGTYEFWKQEHIIFPAIRRNFLPPTSFVNNGIILQIANLSDLYKVFERC